MNPISKTFKQSTVALLGCALLFLACSSNEARLRHSAKNQPATYGDPAPAPEMLARTANVIVIAKDGQISVQGTPLEAGGDLKTLIEKSITKKRKTWPLTIMVDPTQKGETLANVIRVAEEVMPGKVNVITQEVSGEIAAATR